MGPRVDEVDVPPTSKIDRELLLPEDGGLAQVPREFGVWIDSVGFDAMAALGVLQELEKVGRRPKVIVGTGFGCWVALSWALSNNGNRGEFQAFKWPHWNMLPTRSLMARLGQSASRGSFDEDLRVWLPLKSMSDAAIAVDCPYLDVASPNQLINAQSLPLAEALFIQLLIPGLGVPDSVVEREKRLSGGIAGHPTGAELDAYLDQSGLVGSQDLGAWLILTTRSAFERRMSSEISRVVNARTDDVPTEGHTNQGTPWLRLDLSPGSRRTPEELKNPILRRRALLDGRRMGMNWLSTDSVKNLLALPQQ